MKKAALGILKVAIPLALGLWLIYYFYDQLSPQQRSELFTAFGQANWWWLLCCGFFGWLSHLSRAWRWRYLLEHMGYRTSFWNCYHAVMTGYFMNLLIPRAGEASRAVTLYRAEGVPFERGFGTILAERAVDMVMLLAIAAVTLALQWDKIGLFQERIAAFRAQQGPVDRTNGPAWGIAVVALLALAAIAAAYMIWSRPALRARVMDAVRGLIAGVRSVFQTKDKGPYLLHTIFIWAMYVAMFWVGFYALPSVSSVPAAGIMAAFLAGSASIILVQGGIGVFPAFVALILGVYMEPPAGGGLIRPDALAMGWLLWLAQTALVIILGGVSLLLVARAKRPAQA